MGWGASYCNGGETEWPRHGGSVAAGDNKEWQLSEGCTEGGLVAVAVLLLQLVMADEREVNRDMGTCRTCVIKHRAQDFFRFF